MHIAQQCATRATALKSQAQELEKGLQKVMRCFGRQCLGQGKVFVKLVRQTETQLLQVGGTIAELAYRDPAIGDIREAWFVHRGVLYQLMMHAPDQELLEAWYLWTLNNSWRFATL